MNDRNSEFQIVTQRRRCPFDIKMSASRIDVGTVRYFKNKSIFCMSSRSLKPRLNWYIPNIRLTFRVSATAAAWISPISIFLTVR